MIRLFPCFAFLLLAACHHAPPEADAGGNFEATEVTVSALGSGRLVAFHVREGDELAEGEFVGLVDTTQLGLQRQELRARQAAIRTRTLEAGAQVDVLRAQLATAREELARTRRLYEDEAATARQLNQQEGEVAVLEARIQAAQLQIRSAADELAGLEVQVARVSDLIGEQMLLNPVAGTVVTVLARRGEAVLPGRPLYTIADLDTLTLRAYATGGTLPRLRLGQSVPVLFDDGRGGLEERAGRITWISPRAEFTPNTLQTREDRVDLVYAFEVAVPNPDGRIKIGMPGEVRLVEGEADGR